MFPLTRLEKVILRIPIIIRNGTFLSVETREKSFICMPSDQLFCILKILWRVVLHLSRHAPNQDALTPCIRLIAMVIAMITNF